MAFQLAEKAKGDLSDIWCYVAEESGNFDIAFRQVDVFLQRFEFLSTHPYAGRARDELQPGLRSFPVGQYVIFYRVVSSDALILRVMHGRRDIDATFQQ